MHTDTQTPDTSSDGAEQARIPLVVDLDGTLCRTDTLEEALLGLAAREPLRLLEVPRWLRDGRAGLKAHLADHGIIDPATLPLNEAVVAAVTAARDAGRPTALVSAADHRQVTAVAEATGLFDAAYGSADGVNLKGDRKADFLCQLYGEKGFDYVGDSAADAPVWAAARRAITVGAGTALRRTAEAANPRASHIGPAPGRAAAALRAMRPYQWSKNLLLFLPALAAHDPARLPAVLLGFIAFCLTASAVYMINDLIDLPADRAHPRKRNRPFAAGTLTAREGLALTLGILALGLAAGLLTGSPAFLGVMCLYFGATLAYSLWLKRKLIIDVLVLAGLYTVRIVAGGAAAGVVLSPWMLGFSMFLFLALAAIKRQAELTDQLASGRESAGRAYEVDDLPLLRSLAISAGQAAVLVLALYISSDDVQRLYSRPWLLWLVAPVMLYWLLRMVMKTHRGLMTDDPIVFAATDRVSLALVLVSAAVVLAAAL